MRVVGVLRPAGTPIGLRRDQAHGWAVRIRLVLVAILLDRALEFGHDDLLDLFPLGQT